MRCGRVIVLLSLLLAGGLAAEEAGGAPRTGVLPMAPAPGPVPDFKPYIFWAYGLACLLIFLFILWTLSQLRRVEDKVDHLARTQAERRSGTG